MLRTKLILCEVKSILEKVGGRVIIAGDVRDVEGKTWEKKLENREIQKK